MEILETNCITIAPTNVIIDCRIAKIVFNKSEVKICDLLDVYIQLKNYLNSFENVNV